MFVAVMGGVVELVLVGQKGSGGAAEGSGLDRAVYSSLAWLEFMINLSLSK